MVSAPDIASFEHFIEQSTHLLHSEHTTLSEGFTAFITESTKLLVEPLREDIHRWRGPALVARRLLPSFDLLAVARVSGSEDPYTELLAWALSPETHPPSALDRQRSCLRAFAPGAALIDSPCVPETQVITDDGIPDLVLAYDHFAVVIEAKTHSVEHPAPRSGEMQTIAYPKSVRRLLGMPPEFPVQVAYLTLDGSRAAAENAALVTWAGVALRLLDALDGHDFSADVQVGLGTVIRHFLSYGGGVDVPLLLQRISELGKHQDSQFIIDRLPHLLRLQELERPRRSE